MRGFLLNVIQIRWWWRLCILYSYSYLSTTYLRIRLVYLLHASYVDSVYWCKMLRIHNEKLRFISRKWKLYVVSLLSFALKGCRGTCFIRKNVAQQLPPFCFFLYSFCKMCTLAALFHVIFIDVVESISTKFPPLLFHLF